MRKQRDLEVTYVEATDVPEEVRQRKLERAFDTLFEATLRRLAKEKGSKFFSF